MRKNYFTKAFIPTNKLARRFVSTTIVIGMILSILGIGQVGVGADTLDSFVADDGNSKKYVVVTKTEKAAGQINQVFNDDSQETIHSESEDVLNSSYIGEGSFEEQVESLENAMTENGIVTVELSDKELEQVENSNNVLCVEEDFNLKANSLKQTDKKDKSGKKSLSKFKMLEQYWKAQKYIEANVDPDWNMKAIDSDKLIRFREHPKKEKAKNLKIGENLKLEDVNRYSDAKKKVKVAVLDSGVDVVMGLDDFEQINLVPEDHEITMMYQDMTGHGTAIASVIAGNNENGIQGVNRNVELCSVKVLDSDNKAPLSRIVEGIYWCIDNDVNIINMSFGTSNKSVALEKAIKDAYDAGILMIAAAGNGGEEIAVEYPAAFDEVMAVASTNEKAEISNFSNTGGELDIAAPGEKIPVTGFFGLCGITHGTSIAVPHVTGVASLLWEKDLSRSSDFIRQLIEYSAKSIDDTDDCGLLDADRAMANYDEFVKSYEAVENFGIKTDSPVGKMILENSVEANNAEPESFDEISEDEAYVEGRWGSGEGSKEGHLDCLTDSDYFKNSFSSENKYLLKAGIIAPDKEKYGIKHDDPYHYPYWHGWFRHRYQKSKKCNYIAGIDLISRLAMAGGSWSSVGNNKYGLQDDMYSSLKFDLLDGEYFGDKTWAQTLHNLEVNGTYDYYENTSQNRKYFLWGAMMHSLTDSCAHSSAGKDSSGNFFFIQHTNNKVNEYDKDADDPTYYPGRFTLAKALAYEALWDLKNGWNVNYLDYYYALQQVNFTTASKNYRLINLYEYAKGNESAEGDNRPETHTLLSNASIDGDSRNW